MKLYYSIFLWITLTILSMIAQDIALFAQTRESMINDSLLQKIINNEFYATILWMLAIPAMRIGYTIMNPIKLTMFAYLFLFGGQIVTNYVWLNEPTTVDDYAAIVIVIAGLLVSSYKVFG
jgi:hypothetical protein